MRSIWIPGKVQGKARPRLSKGRNIYTPIQTVNYEKLIASSYLEKHSHKEIYKGAVKILMVALYKIPKNTSKVKKDLMLRNLIRPTIKPDIDNVIKVVCDALNKVAYEDDKQIVEVQSEKKYSENPGLFIKLEEVKCE